MRAKHRTSFLAWLDEAFYLLSRSSNFASRPGKVLDQLPVNTKDTSSVVLEAMWHTELGTKSSPDGAESVRERTAGASGRHHSCIPIRKPVGLRVPTPRHAAYLDGMARGSSSIISRCEVLTSWTELIRAV